MKDVLINTTSVESLYASLSEFFKVEEEVLKRFISNNIDEYINMDCRDVDLDKFFDIFNIKGNELVFNYITINHVTTRLDKEINLDTFKIDNLENVLLSENSLTNFLKNKGIEFRMNEGIEVCYNGKVVNFTGIYSTRLNKRLKCLKDSCINGFLFGDEIPSTYESLTAVPEIVSDIIMELDKKEFISEYAMHVRYFVASITVSIDDLIIDELSFITSKIEKSKNILRYILIYLAYKNVNSIYNSCKNPIIRLPDNKNVTKDNIFNLREIQHYKEVFKR